MGSSHSNAYSPYFPFNSHTAVIFIAMSNLDSELLATTTKLTISHEESALQSDDDSDSNTIGENSNALNSHAEAIKRRRSSAASVSSNPVPKKIHKKKLEKSLGKPRIQVNEENYHVSDYRDLILSIFTGVKSAGRKIEVLYGDNISKIVYVLADKIVPEDFKSSVTESKDIVIESPFEFINENFDKISYITNPGSKSMLHPVLDTLTNIRLNKKEVQVALQSLKTNKITINDLSLTPNALKWNGYPIHSSIEELVTVTRDSMDRFGTSKTVSEDEWVETVETDDDKHIYAMDCEFCLGNNGHVLTRISIVDFSGSTLYDTYVKPSTEIIDYLTKFSGITQEKLENVTTTLADVQQKVIEIIHKQDIIIGHSLESDLNVIKIRHPNIVDTSLCYHSVRGPPYKPGLKYLAKLHLGKSIQEGETSGEGHSSVEDALTCLELVKMKILNGQLFGEQVKNDSIFKRIDHHRRLKGKQPIKSLIIDRRYQNSQNETVRTVGVCSDEEALEALGLGKEDYDISIVSLYDNDKLSTNLGKIYQSLPSNSLFIISNLPPTEQVNLLQRQKNDFKKFKGQLEEWEGDVWDFDKEVMLKQEVQSSRRGVSFIKIKD